VTHSAWSICRNVFDQAKSARSLASTAYGQVRVDVLEVRQVEIDQPSDDPGDRLHASAHAWANDSATEITIEVVPLSGARVEVSTLVAEPGPLVAMKICSLGTATPVSCTAELLRCGTGGLLMTANPWPSAREQRLKSLAFALWGAIPDPA
jgi:hypothetical protein